MISIKKKLKNKNIKFIFGFILLITLNFSADYFIRPPVIKTNSDLDDLKSSVVFYNIEIDDLPGSLTDWSWAETQPWFGGGSGTELDPYILEDLIVDGNLTESCISISNSEAFFQIKGCTLNNSATGTNGAIYLYNVTNGVIIGNLLSNNCHGIYLEGSSSYNEINDNEIYGDGTGTGIIIWDCDENNVINNTVEDCWQGIWIYAALSTTLVGNEVSNNLQNGIIILQYSYYTFVSGNIAENNVLSGISFSWSFDSIIESNFLDDNMQAGIYLDNSDDNIALNNELSDNDLYGVSLSTGSDGNLFYQNYFLNNTDNAIDNGANNNWNNTVIGNYWDNYSGYDMNLDGIGDTPHDVPPLGGSQDYFPIWNKQEPIAIDDLPGSLTNWSWVETQPWFGGGSGTELNPYIIENMNIDANLTDSCISILNSEAYFIIRGCNLDNSVLSGTDGGIYLYNVTNGNILSNNFDNNKGAGILGIMSSNNTISGNSLNNGRHGIHIFGDYNEIFNNDIYGDGTGSGIVLEGSYIGNNVNGNTIENCWQGIWLSGVDNNTVLGNEASQNLQNGIVLATDSNFNYISGNFVENNALNGFYVLGGDDNIIHNNIIRYNVLDGINILTGSSNNLIYRNFFRGNGRHAYDDGEFNDWNSTTLGNYWDNHTGPDTSPNDGIVDTPYTFIDGSAGSIDYLPIAEDGPPSIIINFPSENGVFGTTAPGFSVDITDNFLDDMWYTLDGGLHNYTFTGSTGTINQTAWDELPDGMVTITFYASDYADNIGSAEVTIEKNSLLPPDDNIVLIVIVISIVSGLAIVIAVVFIVRRKRKVGKAN